MEYFVGLFLGFILGFMVAVSPSYDVGYKKGQIDAINGIIKYELVDMPDQTKDWRKIE
jgi:hypothetical protein